jgi:Histidine kinase
MTTPAPDSGLESWDNRLETLGRIGPYVLLLISTLVAVMAGPWKNIGVTLGLAVFAAAWTAWWATLHPGWTQRRTLMGIYYAGLIALIAALVARTPWFGFFAFSGVMVALQLFRGFWRYAGVFVPTVFIAVCQTGGFHPLSVGLVVVILVLAAFQSTMYIGFGLMGEKSEEQNRKRKRMIDELAEANRRLEETLAEKAGLQAQLLTQAREAGVSAERQRMAREIHDTLAQGLAGIITQLEAAQQATGGPAGGHPAGRADARPGARQRAAQPARARGARPGGAGGGKPRGGRAAVHQRGDGEDAPHAHLREAGRQRPGRGRRGGLRPRAAHPRRALSGRRPPDRPAGPRAPQ